MLSMHVFVSTICRAAAKTSIRRASIGAFQLRQLYLDLAFEVRPSALLLGIVCSEPLQRLKEGRYLLHRRSVCIEIRVVSGDQEATLASFGVPHRSSERLRRSGFGDMRPVTCIASILDRIPVTCNGALQNSSSEIYVE
jgi:hypothetical protein